MSWTIVYVNERFLKRMLLWDILWYQLTSNWRLGAGRGRVLLRGRMPEHKEGNRLQGRRRTGPGLKERLIGWPGLRGTTWSGREISPLFKCPQLVAMITLANTFWLSSLITNKLSVRFYGSKPSLTIATEFWENHWKTINVNGPSTGSPACSKMLFLFPWSLDYLLLLQAETKAAPAEAKKANACEAKK